MKDQITRKFKGKVYFLSATLFTKKGAAFEKSRMMVDHFVRVIEIKARGHTAYFIWARKK